MRFQLCSAALVFSLLHSFASAGDLGFRYLCYPGNFCRAGGGNFACVNAKGQLGMNPNFLGECGDLKDAKLAGADLRGKRLVAADLSGADLSRADLSGANLELAVMNQANFEGAVLKGARIVHCSLASTEGVSFENADLSSANFLGCSLGATVNVEGASFENADLRQAHFQSLSTADRVKSWKGARYSGVGCYAKTYLSLISNGINPHEPDHVQQAKALGMIQVDCL